MARDMAGAGLPLCDGVAPFLRDAPPASHDVARRPPGSEVCFCASFLVQTKKER
jgi:hypothetical protein